MLARTSVGAAIGCCVGVALLASAVYGADDTAQTLVLERSCASYATTLMLRRLGHQVAFETVDRIIDPDGDGLGSLDGVLDALGRLGSEAADARRFPTEELPHWSGIIRFERRDDGSPLSHYVYIEPEEDDEHYLVFMPPLGVYRWKKAQIEQLWSGEMVFCPSRISDKYALPDWSVSALGAVIGALSLLVISRAFSYRNESVRSA